MLFFSLKKGPTPTIFMLCFVIKKVYFLNFFMCLYLRLIKVNLVIVVFTIFTLTVSKNKTTLFLFVFYNTLFHS